MKWDRMDQRAAGKRATLAGSQQELFSLTAATSRGMTVEISGDGCVVKKCGWIVAMGSRRGNLITFTVEATAECHADSKATAEGYSRNDHGIRRSKARS